MVRKNISKKMLYVMTAVLLLLIMLIPFSAFAETQDGYWTTHIDGTGQEVSVFVYYDEPLEITVLENSEDICFDAVGEEVSEFGKVNANVQLAIAEADPIAVKANEVNEVNSVSENKAVKKDYTLIFVAVVVLLVLVFFGYYMIKAI